MSVSGTATSLEDAGSPLPRGLETRVRFLALLLRLPFGIALLLSFLAAFATRRRRAQGLWYLSADTQDEIDALSPRDQRTLRRLLAIIGWAMAGVHNRGMRPRPRQATPGLRPTGGPRAPPLPA